MQEGRITDQRDVSELKLKRQNLSSHLKENDCISSLSYFGRHPLRHTAFYAHFPSLIKRYPSAHWELTGREDRAGSRTDRFYVIFTIQYGLIAGRMQHPLNLESSSKTVFAEEFQTFHHNLGRFFPLVINAPILNYGLQMRAVRPSQCPLLGKCSRSRMLHLRVRVTPILSAL